MPPRTETGFEWIFFMEKRMLKADWSHILKQWNEYTRFCVKKQVPEENIPQE